MKNPKLINSIALAYIGDAYFEILVRDYLVLSLGLVKPKDLHMEAKYYVSARAQVGFMKYALEKDFFNEEEIQQFKRGRNKKNTRSTKTLDANTHNKSTGFESIIGYYYVLNNFNRINEIFEIYKEYVNGYKASLLVRQS